MGPKEACSPITQFERFLDKIYFSDRICYSFMMDGSIGREHPSLLQLELLRNSTSSKLEELGFLRRETESLEKSYRCKCSEIVSFQADREAAEAAVVQKLQTNISVAAQRSTIVTELNYLRHEITIQQKELQTLTMAGGKRRLELTTECEQLMLDLKYEKTEEVQQNKAAQCSLREADIRRELEGKRRTIARLEVESAVLHAQKKEAISSRLRIQKAMHGLQL